MVLHGELAQLFAPEFRLDVTTPAEAVRAIQANRPSFYQYLHEAGERGIGFVIVLRDRNDPSKLYNLDQSELTHPIGDRVMDIVPMPVGAGDVFRVVLGVILVVVGAIASIFPGGQAIGPYLIGLGVSLVVGGVISLISPQPRIDAGTLGADELASANNRKSSYAFSGPVNTTGQGRPVPVGYGLVLTGSHVVSAGLRNVDQSTPLGEPDWTVDPSNPGPQWEWEIPNIGPIVIGPIGF